MKQGETPSDITVTVKERLASPACESKAPSGRAAKRQLKDYPQSLQTAARALWD